jgi:hypothetical protein
MTITTTISRGIRNNNPGNLRATALIKWRGQTGEDAEGFCIFDNPISGCRAMLLDLLNAQQKDKLTTLEILISHYAPPDENDTPAYIHEVSTVTLIKPTDVLVPKYDTIEIARAMAIHELGSTYFPYPWWNLASAQLASEGLWPK